MIRPFAVFACLLTFAAATALASDLYAAPIQFTYTSVSSGTIGELSFASVDVTIVAHGDTSNRQELGDDGYYVEHAAASVVLDGIGTFEFLTNTQTFISTDGEYLAFMRSPPQSRNLVAMLLAPAAEPWDMQKSFGPVVGGPTIGTGVFMQWTIDPPIMTSGGRLQFFGPRGPTGTFQATVVPEPSTIALGALALVGLLAFPRRR